MELVLLRDLGEGRWERLSRPGRKTKPGTELSFGDGQLTAVVEQVAEGGNRIVKNSNYEGIFLEVLGAPRQDAAAAIHKGGASGLRALSDGVLKRSLGAPPHRLRGCTSQRSCWKK